MERKAEICRSARAWRRSRSGSASRLAGAREPGGGAGRDPAREGEGIQLVGVAARRSALLAGSSGGPVAAEVLQHAAGLHRWLRRVATSTSLEVQDEDGEPPPPPSCSSASPHSPPLPLPRPGRGSSHALVHVGVTLIVCSMNCCKRW